MTTRVCNVVLALVALTAPPAAQNIALRGDGLRLIPQTTAPANCTAGRFCLWVDAASSTLKFTNIAAFNFADATVSQTTNINTAVTINGASGVITTQTATTATRTAETG